MIVLPIGCSYEREKTSRLFLFRSGVRAHALKTWLLLVRVVSANVKINDVVVVMVVAIAVAPGSCRLVEMAKLIIPFSRMKQPAKLGEVLRAIIFKFSSTDQSNWKKLINWARTSLHRSDP